jgi:hypothetical protein
VHFTYNTAAATRILLAGFTLVLSLLLLFFGFVLYLSAVRGSSSSSSSGQWLGTAKPVLLPSQQASSASSSKAAAAAAAARPAVLPCLTLLQQLLPRANISTLSTADLLDAAAAAQLDSAGIRQLMQLQQELFCK